MAATDTDGKDVKVPQSSLGVSLLGYFAFMCFGLGTFATPILGFRASNVAFGVIIGLIFGAVCKMFLTALLSRGNAEVKSKFGDKVIKAVVERGFVFLIPFAVMAVIAVYLMGWNCAPVFVSAGLMSAGALGAMEVGRLKGKKEIKTSVKASVAAWVFSTLWVFSAGYLGKIPLYAEGVANLVKVFVGGNAG